MTTVTLTPIVDADAVELSAGSGKWRKQILPKGKFTYQGKTLNFDEIAPKVKQAFDAKALDQVAFQFADAGNNHNFDPKNYGGELVGVELTNDGLYGTFDFTKNPETAAFVAKNPKFGVSARIEQSLERGDGKKFEYAFSHVLGTLNPKVTGMKPWEKVELSNVDDSDSDVVDFTNAEGEKVPDTKTPNTDVTLSAEDLALLKEWKTEQEQIKLFAAQLSNGTGGSEGGSETNTALELAQQTAKEAIELARTSQREAATERWERKASELVNAGVPPVVLDLAKDVMSAAKFDVGAIELSNGDKVNPQEVMLKMMDALKGTVDLSESKGHQFTGEESGTGADDAEFEAYRKQFFADQF